MRLEAIIAPRLIFPGLRCSDASSALRLLAQRIVEHGGGPLRDAEALYEELWEREKLGSTGIGAGVAIPHCKMSGLDEVVVAIGLFDRAIDFGAVDQKPVRLFFCVVSPSDSPTVHLQCLAAISRWIKTDQHHVERLLELDDPEAIWKLLGEGG